MTMVVSPALKVVSFVESAVANTMSPQTFRTRLLDSARTDLVEMSS